MTMLSSLGHAFHTGAPVSVFLHLFPKKKKKKKKKKKFIIYYLLYKHLLPAVNTFFVLTIDDFSCFLAIRNPCRPWIGAVLIINP
jgi:hypothetical protein